MKKMTVEVWSGDDRVAEEDVSDYRDLLVKYAAAQVMGYGIELKGDHVAENMVSMWVANTAHEQVIRHSREYLTDHTLFGGISHTASRFAAYTVLAKLGGFLTLSLEESIIAVLALLAVSFVFALLNGRTHFNRWFDKKIVRNVLAIEMDMDDAKWFLRGNDEDTTGA